MSTGSSIDYKELYYIDENYTVTKVLDNFIEYSMSNSNEVLVKADTSIYKMDKNKSEKVLDVDCKKFYATSNASNFYYGTDQKELYYKKGNEAPCLIANSVDCYNMAICGDIIYYGVIEEDGSETLYYTMGGEPGKKVKTYLLWIIIKDW